MLQATDWWLLLLAGAIFTVALLCHHPGLPHRRRQHGGAVRVCLYSLGQFGRLPDLCGCARPAHDDWRGGYCYQWLLHYFARAAAVYGTVG